ncbi:fasciclin [Flavobacteriaceae bacterium TP-CH-4]|uniref:Fasciclin n=1 Tax=Pelagihabitans pacificus TaxID=2696054 RepID=A0A967API8_9FLAO|nr:fasciclin domain-containing protein [Pelagihabitans pacificus]NHF58056.1 fasciclin [Pelagihabitans pacificus]
MKKFIRLKNRLLLATLTLFAFSCDKDDDNVIERNNDDGNTIAAVASGEASLSSLVAALVQADAGLVEALSDDTATYTVFAPTNTAFTVLLESLDGYDSLEDFDTDEEKALLAKILTYHVVSGVAAKSTDLSDGQAIGTLQGEDVTVRLEGGVFIQDATEDDAQVTLPDVEASNGVVHLIDKVLLPQEVLDALSGEEMESKNLVEIVVETEALSILEAAVIKAGLAETLSSEGPFTVFAPTDDAFVTLLDILGDDYNGLDDFDTEAEMMLLKDILLYHVIAGATVKEADLAEGSVETALTGNSIDVIASGDTFVIGDASDTDANITGTDIMASNGVAHTIDKVLLPQSAIDFVASLSLKTIVELAIETDDLSLLVGALQQADAGLVETLSGDGPFTVFAPTNEAFVALLEALGDDFNSLADFDTAEEKDLLVKVLTYHVVAGTAAFSTDLSNGQMIETFQGENVLINIKDGTVHVDDATDTNASVVIPDVEASNGVVHIVDKVLLPQEVLDLLSPPTPNIVGLAQSVPDLSLLVDALIQADAGLVEVLSGDGPFTVFAPTNQAFADLLDVLGHDYTSLDDFDTDEEKELLAAVLTYHVVVGAAIASDDLTDHQELVTVQGESLFALTGHGIQIRDRSTTDANVALADQLASNGIVHVVDKVLLPQEVLEAFHLPIRH